MPMPENAIAAQGISQKLNPTLVQPMKDLGMYNAVLARDDIPETATPSEEIRWISVQIPRPVPDYANSPSKVAATWLRRLRMKKTLRDKFWSDTWSTYMELRLGLELRAAAPPKAPVRGVRSKSLRSDEDVQNQIGKLGSMK